MVLIWPLILPVVPAAVGEGERSVEQEVSSYALATLSGTDITYAATRHGTESSVARGEVRYLPTRTPLPAYANPAIFLYALSVYKRTMPCPGLT